MEQQTNPGRMSIEQQRAAGLRPQQTNLVRAMGSDAQPLPSVGGMGGGDLLDRLTDALTFGHRQPNRGAQSNDTAISQSLGWILSATPFVSTVAIIVSAVLFAFWLFHGGGGLADYAAAWLLMFGMGALIVLAYAHRQHLAHSPAGVELSDIARQRADSTNRTTVALSAISAHQQVVNKTLDYSQERWLLEHNFAPTDRQITDGGDQ